MVARFEDDDNSVEHGRRQSPLTIPEWPSWSTRCPSRRISGCCPAQRRQFGRTHRGKRAQGDPGHRGAQGPTSSPARYAGCIRQRPLLRLAHCWDHDGGYARFSPALWQWVRGIQCKPASMEPIYSGKGDDGGCFANGGGTHARQQRSHPHRWLCRGWRGRKWTGPPVATGTLVGQVEGLGGRQTGDLGPACTPRCRNIFHSSPLSPPPR